MVISRAASWTLVSVCFLSVFSIWSAADWACAQFSQSDDSTVTEHQRPIGDIRKDVAAFIKRSKSKVPDEQAAAVFDLCLLHREIVNDPRFERDNNLVSFRAMIGSRLKKCKSEIEIAQKRELRARKRNRNADQAAEMAEADRKLLAVAEEDSDENLVAQAMADHLHAIGQVTGGPTQILDYANGNFGGGHALELINLIESTIAPGSWRSAGGDGQMFFYRPVLALVVSANVDVQGRVENLLRTIRRNQ